MHNKFLKTQILPSMFLGCYKKKKLPVSIWKITQFWGMKGCIIHHKIHKSLKNIKLQFTFNT